MNKFVVMLLDWLTHLDSAVLPAVRQNEEELRKEYEKALHGGAVASLPEK